MDWQSSCDREAELRRRNEEINLRQGEAVRLAEAVVRQQEAKLVLSPSQIRSPSRQDRVSRSSTGVPPERPASARVSTSNYSGHDHDLDDEEGEVQGEDDEQGYEEQYDRPAITKRVSSRQTTPADSARRELHMEEGRGTDREGVTPQMGAEATIRYLKAKLKVVEEELEESVAEAKESRERLASSEKRLHDLEQTSAKAGSMQTSARLKADKLKKELEEKANLELHTRFISSCLKRL